MAVDADKAGKKEEVALLNSDELLLDNTNPRFGAPIQGTRSQTEILDYVVRNFGVDDVLSSLSVNGYFSAEPLVGKWKEELGKFIVVEGNRRLAACLILLGDDRAKNQSSRTNKYQEIYKVNGEPKIHPIPTLIFPEDTDNKKVLSYLGVRHIASAQQWDSYAKAVWISRVVSETDLTTSAVAQMIGDAHKTVERLLEGYHFITQLESAGLFYPENSVRKGRGSNTSYPFSWVYTILGYKAVRDFLQIDEDRSVANPIPDKALDDAALLATAMFGDSSRGLSSALTDSRQLTKLASAVRDPEKVRLLKKGKDLAQIDKETQPMEDALESGLGRAHDELATLTHRLSADPPSPKVADSFVHPARRVRSLSAAVHEKLQKISQEDEFGDDGEY